MCAEENDVVGTIPTARDEALETDSPNSETDDSVQAAVAGSEPDADDEPQGDTEEQQDAKGKAWDKDRQKRDEERAARQKATEDRVNAVSEKLDALPDQITDQIVKRLLGQDRVKSDNLVQQEQTDDVLTVLESLGEDADYETVIRAIKSVPKAIKGRDLLIKKLEAEQAAQKETLTARQRADDDKRISDEQWKLCDALDKQYADSTPVLRADALERTRKLLAEEGYTATDLPYPKTVRAFIRLAYREVADEAEKQKERHKNEPKQDSMVGGSKADRAKRGSLDEVYDQMKSDGEV